MNQFYTALSLVILWTGNYLWAEAPPSRLVLAKSLYENDRDNEKIVWPYRAVIFNATSNSELSSFILSLKRFKGVPSVKTGELTDLVIEKTTFTEEQARQLETVSTRSLEILNCDVSDEVAKSLGRIDCSSLILNQIRISNRALAGLLAGQKSKLKVLKVSEVRGCTAEGWRGWSDQALVSLELADCDFDDQALLNLPNCEELRVKNAQLTGETLSSLRSQTGMRVLSIWDCPITDQGLGLLPELPKLKALFLKRTHVTGATFSKLSSQKNLDILVLSDCPITDEGLGLLPDLPKLKRLDLSGTLVTDAGLSNLKLLPSLEVIYAGNTKVSLDCALELSRQHPLSISFRMDPRWPPRGGYCRDGKFQLK